MKHTHYQDHSKKYFLGGLCALGLVGGIAATGATYALTYQDTADVSFTIQPSVRVTLSGDLIIDDLSPNQGKDSNIITVTAESNSPAGYTVGATVGNSTDYPTTSLKHKTDASATADSFTSLGITDSVSTLAEITPGMWGYSFSLDNGTSWINATKTGDVNNTGYSGLPLYTTDSPAELVSSGTNASSTFQFKIAASAKPTQAAGEYNNVINFVATANPVPEPVTEAKCTTPIPNVNITYMQQINSSNKATVLSNMTQGAQYVLKDNRDEKSYCVAKQADGNIWMTQNLDLEIGGTGVAPLTSENTDLNTSGSGAYATDYSESNGVITWQPTLANTNATVTGSPAQITNYASGSPSNSVTGWTNDSNLPYMAEGGDHYVYTSGSTSYDTIYNSLTDCMNASHAAEECVHYHVGNYYNWSTAIASSNSSSLSTQYDTAMNSICPKGWRLPKGQSASSSTASTREFGELFRASEITSSIAATSYTTDGFNNIRKDPLFFVRGGYVNGTTFYYGTNSGYFWSSSVSSTTGAYSAYFGSSSIDSAYGISRYRGDSIRCIAE